MAENDSWPSDSFKKLIESFGKMVQAIEQPLNNGLFTDVTEENINLIQENFPQVYLQGQDLINEQNSSDWVGIFYRVLKKNSSESSKMLQFIYIWRKQRIMFTFLSFLLPILIMIFISIFIESDLFFIQTYYSSSILDKYPAINSLVSVTDKY